MLEAVTPPPPDLPWPPNALTFWLTGLVFGILFVSAVLNLAALMGLHPRGAFALPRDMPPLEQRPWTRRDALVVVTVLVWLFLPGAVRRMVDPAPQVVRPDALGLWLQFALLHLLPLGLIALCLRRRGRQWREAFAVPTISSARAARLGLMFGLAWIGPVVLSAYAWHFALDGLGIARIPQPAVSWMLERDPDLHRRLMLAAMALFSAPVVEEVVLRGILLPVVIRHVGVPLAVGLVSLLFAAIHLHLGSLIPLTVLGVGFALAYRRTGHLLTPVVMHVAVNAFNLAAMFAR